MPAVSFCFHFLTVWQIWEDGGWWGERSSSLNHFLGPRSHIHTYPLSRRLLRQGGERPSLRIRRVCHTVHMIWCQTDVQMAVEPLESIVCLHQCHFRICLSITSLRSFHPADLLTPYEKTCSRCMQPADPPPPPPHTHTHTLCHLRVNLQQHGCLSSIFYGWTEIRKGKPKFALCFVAHRVTNQRCFGGSPQDESSWIWCWPNVWALVCYRQIIASPTRTAERSEEIKTREEEDSFKRTQCVCVCVSLRENLEEIAAHRKPTFNHSAHCLSLSSHFLAKPSNIWCLHPLKFVDKLLFRVLHCSNLIIFRSWTEPELK